MDCFILFINQHLDYAPWIIWGALMLAGLNFPISEDVMLITAGVLAATVMPEHRLQLFIFAFAGCYLSDWVAYWLGRLLGRKIIFMKWFRRFMRVGRIRRAEQFYRRYGMLTLFIGRFIPFGVRNLLFITAGLGKMHFGKFVVSDGLACFISNATLFYLAYSCGKNYEAINSYRGFWYILTMVVVVIVVLFIVVYRRTKRLVKEAS